MAVGSTWFRLLRSTVLCGLLSSAGCAGEALEESAGESELVETQTSELQSSITVVEDAYVRGGSYFADRNYGTRTTLSASPGTGSSERFALLKINVPASATALSSASLRVYSASAQGAVQAFGVSSGWSESTVTYRSAPKPSGSPLASRTITQAGWQTLDVTSYVRANLGKTIALALRADGSAATVTFNAREASSNRPSLSLITADSCVPQSCGQSCGAIPDGCGGTLQCTPCPVPVPQTGSMVIGANFWPHTWGNGPSDYFKSGVNWSTTTDPWNPQLLSDLSYAKVLRFMDWATINGSRMVRWSDRVPKTGNQYAYQVQASAGDGSLITGYGVAYEWQIDLANRTGADFWVNVPHGADDDFVLQLARLVQTQLRSDKKVYVEYSNEVWNAGFYQNKYCADKAAAAGLPGTVAYKGKNVTLNPWLSYSTFRALQVFAIFEQVFGKDNPRVVKTLAGQLGYNNWPDFVNTWGDIHPLANQHMAAIHSAAHNPQGVKVSAYAMAPYWSGSNVSEMRNTLNRLEESMRETRRALDLEGSAIPLVCYEGGQDGANQVANANDPAIYQLTLDAYTRFKPLVNGPFVTYTHVGWDAIHAWGLKKSTSSTLAESHKYRATLDWVRANP